MIIGVITAGPIETNAYVVGDESSRDAIVIDAPPDSLQLILDAVRDENVTVRLIVLTHAHYDHVIDAAALKRETGAPLAISADALEHLKQGVRAGSVPYQIDEVGPDQILADGDVIPVGQYQFRVMLTPGHAPGQISLAEESQDVVFGGDTLFPGGYGRADLPESSEEDTRASMRRMLTLSDRATVFPGHGRSTTIGNERAWMERVVERGLF
jgi:hydroxyacylglutathione hydrolase